MAEHTTILSRVNVHIGRTVFEPSHFIPRNVSLRFLQRGCKKRCYGKFDVRVSSLGVFDFSAHTSMFRGRNVSLKENLMRCCCFGALINPDSATVSNWVPVLDQVLMMVSIVLTYIAGVVPPDMTYSNSVKMPVLDATPPRSSSGSDLKIDPQANKEYAWIEVKRKLLGALDSIVKDYSLGNSDVECGSYSVKCPLSLSAVAEGPRLRLLWATLQRLEKEVNNISESHQIVDRGVWIATSSEILRLCSQSVFVTWLEEELYLVNKKHDKDILLTMFKRIKQDDNILKNIRRSGKEDLYADLLFFLRFHSLGMGGCYDSKLLARHGVNILEDLVINLADGITTTYLELISVDSNMSSEMNCLDLNLCSLSTRALQKLRNEMALKQWLHQNMNSVVSMYEDRFDLYIFQLQTKESDKSQQDKLHWWKKLTMKKAAFTFSPLQYMQISPLSMSVKRTKELRSLNGWRYYYSLYLEFSDITMPLIRVTFAKVSSAISFLLVCLVGRSLGLIYSGIRQSLGWRNNG
ncbi:hypothetical protein AQUCO_02500107v1 [Aquilegia coerulea]|uniref:DUF3685 domain-containing protein n=1 Tax=Aquilegia coerulea TaxID=218851 RepID=A0A2G5D9I2_AQUCA|nr:hypothetical protein AQUCO_02500107v1 [Aquilegia coerulea]